MCRYWCFICQSALVIKFAGVVCFAYYCNKFLQYGNFFKLVFMQLSPCKRNFAGRFAFMECLLYLYCLLFTVM